MKARLAPYTRTDRALTTGAAFEPDWHGRYGEAYCGLNRAFFGFVQTGIYPEIAFSCWDGYGACVVAETGAWAWAEGRTLPIEMITKPEFYA